MRPAKADSILDPGFQPCNFRSLPFGRCKELMPTYHYIVLPKSHHPYAKIPHFHAGQQILGYHASNIEDAPIYAALWWYVALTSGNVCSEIGITIIRGPRDPARLGGVSR